MIGKSSHNNYIEAALHLLKDEKLDACIRRLFFANSVTYKHDAEKQGTCVYLCADMCVCVSFQ